MTEVSGNRSDLASNVFTLRERHIYTPESTNKTLSEGDIRPCVEVGRSTSCSRDVRETNCCCVSSQISKRIFFSREESTSVNIVDDCCAMLTMSETILERGLVVRGRCHRRRFSDEWGAKILDRLGGFSTMSQPASTMTYSSSCRVVHCHLFKKLELLGEENVPRRIGNKRLVSQQVLSKLELLPSFYIGQLTGLLIFVD